MVKTTTLLTTSTNRKTLFNKHMYSKNDIYTLDKKLRLIVNVTNSHKISVPNNS